jgi:hypothetical protein
VVHFTALSALGSAAISAASYKRSNQAVGVHMNHVRNEAAPVSGEQQRSCLHMGTQGWKAVTPQEAR